MLRRRLTIAALLVLPMLTASLIPAVRARQMAPEVLFAAAPTLQSGDYSLHWAVIALLGTRAIEGDIPVKVSD